MSQIHTKSKPSFFSARACLMKLIMSMKFLQTARKGRKLCKLQKWEKYLPKGLVLLLFHHSSSCLFTRLKPNLQRHSSSLNNHNVLSHYHFQWIYTIFSSGKEVTLVRKASTDSSFVSCCLFFFEADLCLVLLFRETSVFLLAILFQVPHKQLSFITFITSFPSWFAIAVLWQCPQQ